ncbi:sensor histidine kinase [Allocoleopsis sp.]|uniref:sensor histidine kinase n=1 Tax=Allocoleopsis sp. TaxID=3088169 RepID=UPI002FD0AACE
MSRPIQVHNHPFRFLLYLEWMLLFVAIFTELIPAPHQRSFRLPELTVSLIIGFGLMGLRLPTGRQGYKVFYTFIEVLLIVLTSITGGRTVRLFPLLYLIVVTRSCLIFQLPGRLVVTGLSFSLFLLTLVNRFQRIPASPLLQERLQFFILGYALLFGLTFMFVLLSMNSMVAERQSREKLAIANERLRQYALRIENQAILQERNRIARDIHDSLGHSLTALNIQLETALKLWQSNPDKAKTFLARAKQLGSQSLQEVRQSVSAMRSDPVQGRPLEDAIASLTDELQRSTGIVPTCSLILERPLPPDVHTAVYRIVQESLTNIWKYASATEVKIQLQATINELNLSIQDNGRGFNVEANTTGFGLQGMRERTLALGGHLLIYSQPGAGCRITAHFPLPRL